MPSSKKSPLDKHGRVGIADGVLNLVSRIWESAACISDFNVIAYIHVNCPLCSSLLILKGFGNCEDNDTAESRGIENPSELH